MLTLGKHVHKQMERISGKELQDFSMKIDNMSAIQT